jgi:hypothetical protein
MTEEKYVFWEQRQCKPCGGRPQSLCHIAGDLRKTLKCLANQRVLDSWQRKRSQGAVPRIAGTEVMHWLDTVRKIGDSDLLLFLLQMITKQLPDAHVKQWEPISSKQRCMLCNNKCTPEHPFTCPHNHTARVDMASLVRWKLKNSIDLLASTAAVDLDHLTASRNFADHSHWLDLTRQPGGWGFPGENASDHSLRETLTDIEHTEKWVNLCGVLPKGLVSLLQPASCFLRCNDVTAKRAKQTMHGEVAALQLVVIRESRRVIDAWRTLQMKHAPTFTCPPPWLPVHTRDNYVSVWPISSNNVVNHEQLGP